jgi:hypothetical protein
MIETQKYARKPLIVSAVRVTAENFEEIASWCQGEIIHENHDNSGSFRSPDSKRYIRVRVHNPKNPRQTKAFVGDWILYTEQGYKVYTNRAFYASFEPLQNQPANDHIQTDKRVLSKEEQTKMDPAELRELLSEGNTVLEQDLVS